MSPSVLPPEPPERRTLPGQSAPSTLSTRPLTPPSSSAAPGSKIRSTAVSGEASELIVMENGGVNWLLLTLENVATAQAAQYQNELFKEFVDTRPAGQFPADAKQPPRFCHLDEAKKQAYIDHFFEEDLLQLVDLLEKYPKGFYDLDVEDEPYEGKMETSRSRWQKEMAEWKVKKGHRACRACRQRGTSWTTNQRNSKPALLFGTALANERDERISTMLPNKLNTFLGAVDTIFALNKQPYTPWPVGTDRWYEEVRADGTKLRYKSAMRKQTKFDNCGVGESEVTKSLNTFNDTRSANSAAAS